MSLDKELSLRLMLGDLVKNMRSRIIKHSGKKPIKLNDVINDINLCSDTIETAAYEVLRVLGDYVGWGFHVYVYQSNRPSKLTGQYIIELRVTGYKKVMDDEPEGVDKQIEISVKKALAADAAL
jgi:hypothetical protein